MTQRSLSIPPPSPLFTTPGTVSTLTDAEPKPHQFQEKTSNQDYFKGPLVDTVRPYLSFDVDMTHEV